MNNCSVLSCKTITKQHTIIFQGPQLCSSLPDDINKAQEESNEEIFTKSTVMYAFAVVIIFFT
jgi:hypothetical protein